MTPDSHTISGFTARASALAAAAAMAAFLIFFFPAQAPAQDARGTGGEEHVSIDFDNVDIKIFVKFISKLTGKNFVMDSRVKGFVTVISPTKISVKEAFQVFESVLEIHGFSMVTSGTVIKIIPSPSAKADNIDTRLSQGPEKASDRLVTRIISLEFAAAEELKGLLAPLLPKGSVILAYRDTNMLIVTATLASIERVLKIIHTIDVPNIGKKVSIIPVKHADAAKLVKTLSTVYTARIKGRKGPPDAKAMVYFTADDRTNSIILLASNVETDRVARLIGILDQEVPRGEERIRVYYLEHAIAEDLAKVLQKIPTETGNAKAEGKKEAPLLSQKVHINADKATNSLIIMAEKEDYPVLEDVIRKLDIPRAMVYIECLLMEVNATRSLNVGTQWKIGETVDGGSKAIIGGFGGTGESGFIDVEDLAKGFSVGVLGEKFTIGGVTFPDIQAVVNALKADEDVNILSTPQLLTTENKEAVITVGKNVPYQTRSAAESSSETYSSYEYKDVGITLKITPQISKGKLVRLDIFQELTKLDSVSTTNDDRPTTLKRKVETTIIVKDSHSVVIGGLIDESITRAQNQAPCLGGIPVLGWAFKSVTEGAERTNLYVFITPRVVRSPEEASELYGRKKEEIDDSVERKEVFLYEKINRFEENWFGKDAPPNASPPAAPAAGAEE